jgi:hypothetical protein
VCLRHGLSASQRTRVRAHQRAGIPASRMPRGTRLPYPIQVPIQA